MKTITIQIGNSDDKLTQREWAQYIERVQSHLDTYAHEIHFSGFSAGDAAWQNAAWVVIVANEIELSHLKRVLFKTREFYNQDSIAWTEGETELI